MGNGNGEWEWGREVRLGKGMARMMPANARCMDVLGEQANNRGTRIMVIAGIELSKNRDLT
jgi:hypothetical protein